MDLGLKGKVVIVTGGGAGIGAAMCQTFAEEGANVVIADFRPIEDTVSYADKLAQKYQVETLAVKVDVSRPDDVKRLFAETVKKFRTVDILMNNAGKMGLNRIEDITIEELQKFERVNIEGLFLMSQAMVKLHREQKREKSWIVNTISKSAFSTNSGGNSPYIATKGAAAAFTRGLATEVGREGIYVNGIIPGYVVTETTKNIPNAKERSEAMTKIIPVGREAEPKEIADVAVFLCSEKACQVMGVLMDITGGTML
ncbi:SDR family oxidoreductase [Mediterraneibacter sp. NSJ-55]|uniref:SDR family oxidoreductase n=1 Tax=Mediterraneibacter hominis TaxID=2763054 RepID=A0A923LM67_9FIRM|nr:SDR family oxidoreductase [Mediterraneibacter hominis]MBC5690567.1 SDR family oxidoreductase [Mediterraneibacter hominis]